MCCLFTFLFCGRVEDKREILLNITSKKSEQKTVHGGLCKSAMILITVLVADLWSFCAEFSDLRAHMRTIDAR